VFFFFFVLKKSMYTLAERFVSPQVN